MTDYREYSYDEVTAHQVEADIREAKEIEQRAQSWREKRGEEITEQELTKEIESNLEDLALEKQMSPEILAREKEIALSNLKEKEMTPEEISGILNRYASNTEEYLAHGAILTCDKAMLGPITIKIDGKAEKFPGSIKESAQYTILHVEENRKSSTNGLCMATVKDTIKNKNVFPFQCNCSLLPDRQWEIDQIKANMESCKKYGTCSQLMNLSERWDNMPSETEYFNFTDWTGDEEHSGEKVAGINMMSMLFCKHGGLITPVTSGQTVELPKQRNRHLIYVKEPGAVVSGLAKENLDGARAGKVVEYGKTTSMTGSSFKKEGSRGLILHHVNTYTDDNGLVRHRKEFGVDNMEEDYYLVAMAPYFTTRADEYCEPAPTGDTNFGFQLQIILEDDNGENYSMDVIVTDNKASSDLNDPYPHDHIIEFFREGPLNKEIVERDNVSLDKLLGGHGVEVKEVYAYADGAMVVGNYKEGEEGYWMLRKDNIDEEN